MVNTAFVSHPACLEHPGIGGHPECPRRLTVIEDALRVAGLFDFLRVETAPRAERAQLLRVHSAAHLARVLDTVPSDGIDFLDADTFLGPGSAEAALRAAGAVVRAVEIVLAGEVSRAFCSVRPPGHHATRERAMGFCLFNNLAVGVAHALAAGLERVAILDFDAHAGNGTEAIFEDEPRVLLCSTFQHPFYPFTEPALRAGRMVTVPLPAASPREAFRAAVREAWAPELQAFRPEMLFVSAGFDGHVRDDMSDLRLTDADYAWVTHRLVRVAERFAQGRIVSVLEGGYALEYLGAAVAAHVRGLMGV